MGCFTTQKNKKKQAEQSAVKVVNPSENKPTFLPEPALDSQECQNQSNYPRSGPPSFRSKVRTVQHVHWLINNKPKAFSAPSSLSRIEQQQDAQPSSKSEQEDDKQQHHNKVSPPQSVHRKSNLIISDILQPAKTSSASATASGPISPIDKKAFSGQPLPLPSPRPLPLPSECARCPPRESVSCTSLTSTPPSSGAIMKKHGSFKGTAGTIKGSGVVPLSEPLPLPLPKDFSPNSPLFAYDELATACANFSMESCIYDGNSSCMYKGYIRDETTGQRTEIAISRFFAASQSHKDFVNDIKSIFLLQHPNLAKLIGYYARENSCERMLVFERPPNGSLDYLLYGRVDGPPIDWSTRMKIALGAAQGLAYLHEEGPFQAMYCEFKSPNIHVDRDFSAKLIDYGLSSYSQELDMCNSSSLDMRYAAPETSARGLLTPKSNVWSFGIVLLELLTGRRNMDSNYPKEERNLIKWTRSFLSDELRLSLVMDARLKGRFSLKAAKIVADLALSCLQKDPSERPTMRKTLETLKSVQDMKYSSKFPLKEPNSPINESLPQHFSKQSAVPLPRRPMLMSGHYFNSQPLVGTRDTSIAPIKEKEMTRSPSLNGLRYSTCRSNSSMTLTPLRPLKPLIIPPRSCASTIKEETVSPRQAPARVEGF